MVSLWGSNAAKNGEEQDGDSDNPRATSSHGQPALPPQEAEEPDERTNLLRQHQVPGYLSPDDPAVSFADHINKLY